MSKKQNTKEEEKKQRKQNKEQDHAAKKENNKNVSKNEINNKNRIKNMDKHTNKSKNKIKNKKISPLHPVVGTYSRVGIHRGTSRALHQDLPRSRNNKGNKSGRWGLGCGGGASAVLHLSLGPN